MNTKSAIGKKGEEIALKHLLDKEYKILEKNWRFRHMEVDIIAVDSRDLVIVEVKTRSNDSYGDPEQSVSYKKQDFLIAAAEEYVNKKNLTVTIRFDIISILLKQNGFTLNHIEDAFYPRVKRRR
jgi:putative endonuclease